MGQSVILVNQFDQPIGVANKLMAHQRGWCHRAFSVMIFAKEHDEVLCLLQQRALSKYHCPGLWTNSCCSHASPDHVVQKFALQQGLGAQEATKQGVDAPLNHFIKKDAEQRLFEEMGLCLSLTQQDAFLYKAHLENGLIEHEFDHVFFGWMDKQDIAYNPKEAMNVCWMNVQAIVVDMAANPAKYTPWFPQVLSCALDYLARQQCPAKKEPEVDL